MNLGLLPLLVVALLIWAGVFAFLLGMERRVAALERQVESEENSARGAAR